MNDKRRETLGTLLALIDEEAEKQEDPKQFWLDFAKLLFTYVPEAELQNKALDDVWSYLCSLVPILDDSSGLLEDIMCLAERNSLPLDYK